MATARAVVKRLLEAGVTHFVLSPGSRSAPLALAAAAAAAAGRAQLHVRVDERSAGYLAIGLSRGSASGKAVAVICTSGTAVANLWPTVVEASYSGVPLLLLTADRPPELRNTGANQTIDQVGIFGRYVRYAVDLPCSFSEDHSGAVAGAEIQAELSRTITDASRCVAKALAAATCPVDGGPVQLNIGFREPLVPAAGDEMELPEAGPGPIPAPSPRQPREPIDYLLADIGEPGVPVQGMVVVGDVADPAEAKAAVDLAAACGWPLLSEPSGNAAFHPNSIAHFALLLGSERFRSRHRPDFVLTVGRFGLSRPTLELVRSARVHIAVRIAGRDRPDPLRTAAAVLTRVPLPPTFEPGEAFEAGEAFEVPQARLDEGREWLGSWRRAAATAAEIIDEWLTMDNRLLTGPYIARKAVSGLRPGELLFVAASRSVRDVQDFARAGIPSGQVLGNRGASGIDGLVSSAYGAALASKKKTTALMGDLAFLHDINGLLIPVGEPEPDLTIIVSDNNGGGIFSSLEQGDPRFSPIFERVFGTPHNRDVAAVAKAYGVAVERVETRADLDNSLRDGAGPFNNSRNGNGSANNSKNIDGSAGRGSGLRVIVAACVDRQAEAVARAKLAAQIAAALP